MCCICAACRTRRCTRTPLRRAALSVSNNIGEGFERGSAAELIAFLYVARGSAGEVRSMLHFIDRAPDAEHLRCEIALLKTLSDTPEDHGVVGEDAEIALPHTRPTAASPKR